jgi:hypothetical protein
MTNQWRWCCFQLLFSVVVFICPAASYPTAWIHIASFLLVSFLIFSTGSSLSNFIISAPRSLTFDRRAGQ